MAAQGAPQTVQLKVVRRMVSLIDTLVGTVTARMLRGLVYYAN